MAKIDPRLFQAVRKKLNLSSSQTYQRIEKLSRAKFIDRRLAAIALAGELGLNIMKYAGPEDLAQLRSGVQTPSAAVPSVSVARAVSVTKAAKKAQVKRRGNTVFVVHGRNEKLRRAIFGFLRSVGLHPLEWRNALSLTKKGSPYVGEVLDAAFRNAVGIVVLMSSDDEARLKKQFQKSGDGSHEKKLSGQPRPNVLFEAGMAFGKNPDSTILVQVGPIRPFSDVGGRHVVHLSNDAQSRQELVTRLADAGCNVNTSGTDWLNEGDFSV